MRYRHCILISIDNLRFDALSSEHDQRYLKPFALEGLPRTPQLDRLAREGVAFSGCASAAPITPASHGTILTGQFPQRHGVARYLTDSLNASSKTLAERFGRAGFESLACIDFDQLFFQNDLARGSRLIPNGDDRLWIRELAEVARGGQRGFLFLHLSDVHAPYGTRKCPPATDSFGENYERLVRQHGVWLGSRPLPRRHGAGVERAFSRLSRWAAQNEQEARLGLPLYLAGVNHFDSSRFAKILKMLSQAGLLEDTLVVVTSDHGEALHEKPFLSPRQPGDPDRVFFHGEGVLEEVLRVPLIFWAKGLRQGGARWDFPVSSADIAPTLLSMMEVDFDPAEMDGIDRSPLMTMKSKAAERRRAREPSSCYAEAWFHGRDFWKKLATLRKIFGTSADLRQVQGLKRGLALSQRSVRQGCYKFIEDRVWGNRMYNLENDPFERNDLLSYPRLFGNSPAVPGLESLGRYSELALELSRLLPPRVPSPDRARKKTGAKQTSIPEIRDLAERMSALGYR